MIDWKNHPVAALIGGGLALLGIGIAISGMSSCEAKVKETYIKAQLESMPLRKKAHEDLLAEMHWQLEKGIITKEQYQKLMNESVLDKIIQKINPSTQESK